MELLVTLVVALEQSSWLAEPRHSEHLATYRWPRSAERARRALSVRRGRG
jgi:hypothetical protein